MFKLIVLLFAVSNGVAAEQPSGRFKNSAVFDTEKSCMEYLGTEKGRPSMVLIEEMIEQQKGKLLAKVFCVQDGAVREDDKI